MPRCSSAGGGRVSWSRGSSPDGAHESRQSLWMRLSQGRKFVRAEPAEIIVFSRSDIVRHSGPARDEEGMHAHVEVIDDHRERSWLLDLDADFFVAFPADRVAR